jgi:hypothetical protein
MSLASAPSEDPVAIVTRASMAIGGAIAEALAPLQTRHTPAIRIRSLRYQQ